MASTARCNDASAFFPLGGIQINWSDPCWLEKVGYSRSASSISVCRYPLLHSDAENVAASPRESRHSFISVNDIYPVCSLRQAFCSRRRNTFLVLLLCKHHRACTFRHCGLNPAFFEHSISLFTFVLSCLQPSPMRMLECWTGAWFWIDMMVTVVMFC